MTKIAIIGASGKLGGATLSALLKHNLAAPSDIIALTSSLPPSTTTTTTTASTTNPEAAAPPTTSTWTRLAATGAEVRHARFEDPATLERALQGVDRLFLVSTPNIALDFGLGSGYDGTSSSSDIEEGGEEGGKERGRGQGRGRESHHKNAIDAAVRAGVKWIVYSSLAFAFNNGGSVTDAGAGAGEREGAGAGAGAGVGQTSKAGVMRAHLRTETYLRAAGAASGIRFTILREGLYGESWPLYLGYFDVARGAARAEGIVVPLAGDGKVCWTAIHDLGVASALVLASSSSSSSVSSSLQGGEDEEDRFSGKTVYLSTRPGTAMSVAEIARLVGQQRSGNGRDVRVDVVGRREHVRFYVEEKGLARDAVEWWVGTYEALEEGECLVDDPTLEMLLGRVGLKPIPVEETVAGMLEGRGSWKSKQVD